MRGSVVLPAGTGKKVRVAVFAQGDKAKAAEEAGADIVGFDDLAAKIKEGFMDFDVVIASPDAMRVVGQLGQILGPRGLMPNPKVGTVSADVVQAVKNAKAGQVQYRTDKAGIVQCTIGRASFTPEQLKTNLTALIDALNKAKPQGVKGIYLRKVSVSSDDGRGRADRHGGHGAVGDERITNSKACRDRRHEAVEQILRERGGWSHPVRTVKDRWGESSNGRVWQGLRIPVFAIDPSPGADGALGQDVPGRCGHRKDAARRRKAQVAETANAALMQRARHSGKQG